MSDTTVSNPGKKRRLGEILMEAGVLNELQLRAALSEQRKWGGKLGRTLVEMGFVDEDTMVFALSRQLQLPSVDLDKAKLPPEIVQLLRVDVAERYGVFPLAEDRKHKTLHVASSDPTNFEALQELGFAVNQNIKVTVAAGSAIDRAIRRFYYGESTTASSAAKPKDVGMHEEEFGEEQLSKAGSGPQMPGTNGTAALAALTAKLDQMSQQLGQVEKLVAGQVRAMRAIVELLVEKGLISRDEYLSRVRGPGGPG